MNNFEERLGEQKKVEKLLTIPAPMHVEEVKIALDFIKENYTKTKEEIESLLGEVGLDENQRKIVLQYWGEEQQPESLDISSPKPKESSSWDIKTLEEKDDWSAGDRIVFRK